jgi:hypothetical protein
VRKSSIRPSKWTPWGYPERGRAPSLLAIQDHHICSPMPCRVSTPSLTRHLNRVSVCCLIMGRSTIQGSRTVSEWVSENESQQSNSPVEGEWPAVVRHLLSSKRRPHLKTCKSLERTKILWRACCRQYGMCWQPLLWQRINTQQWATIQQWKRFLCGPFRWWRH